MQSIYSHPTSWRSVLILSTHLRLGLPSGLFPYYSNKYLLCWSICVLAEHVQFSLVCGDCLMVVTAAADLVKGSQDISGLLKTDSVCFIRQLGGISWYSLTWCETGSLRLAIVDRPEVDCVASRQKFAMRLSVKGAVIKGTPSNGVHWWRFTLSNAVQWLRLALFNGSQWLRLALSKGFQWLRLALSNVSQWLRLSLSNGSQWLRLALSNGVQWLRLSLPNVIRSFKFTLSNGVI